MIDADIDGIREELKKNPSLANEGLPYDNKNQTLAHPLHCIADGVFINLFSDETAVEIARVFIENGASINGNGQSTDVVDTPLIAAASLRAEKLAAYYMENGADIHRRGTHGGTALHWAAWVGKDVLTEKLIEAGSDIHLRCIDYHSTPLMWTVNGYSFENNGGNQVQCAMHLISKGGMNDLTPDDLKKINEFLPSADTAMKALFN